MFFDLNKNSLPSHSVKIERYNFLNKLTTCITKLDCKKAVITSFVRGT